MTLQHPEMLWLLLLVLVGSALVWSRRPGPGVATRAALLALIVLALSEPVVVVSQSIRTVIYLIDTSLSIPAAEQERAFALAAEQSSALEDDAVAGVITFDTIPAIQALPGQTWPELQPDRGTRTDLSAALQAALSLIPERSGGQIVLMTDGHSDTDASEAVDAIAERGIGLSVSPLQPGDSGPVITSLTVDNPHPAPGETLNGTLTVHAGADGWSGAVELSIGEDSLETLPVALAAGQAQSTPLTLSLPPTLSAGPVQLIADVDGVQTSTSLTITPPPRIWIIAEREQAGAHLAARLTADGLPPVRFRPASVPARIDADLVVLADAPAAFLPDAFDASLEAFVLQGGGLLTLGGDASYDLGEWHTRPLADLLPVRMDPDGALKDDAITLVIALDKSGSMAQSATRSTSESELVQAVGSRLSGGRPAGSKIRLAAEGAVAALELLRDTDRIGVLTIDTKSRWAVSVQGAAAKPAITNRIRSISSGGGGIYTFTALESARDALRASDTPLRHLIFFADTADAGEQSRGDQTAEELVSELAADGITLSVIGIGSRSAQDAAFLQELARRGQGRFHATDDPENLPALFAQETEELLGAAIDESTDLTVSQAAWHPALAEIQWESAPALTGYNRVLPRAEARVVLTTAETPLLSTWRVGLGEVTSLATDDGGRWTAGWKGWEGGDRLWVQLVRAMLDGEHRDTRIEISPEGTVTIARYGPDGLSRPRPVVLASQGDTPAPLALRTTAPGLWTGQLPLTEGRWRVAALDERGDPLAEARWEAPSSTEHIHRETAGETLEALSRASIQAQSNQRSAMPLWPLAVLLAGLLLPLDAFARKRARR